MFYNANVYFWCKSYYQELPNYTDYVNSDDCEHDYDWCYWELNENEKCLLLTSDTDGGDNERGIPLFD